MLRFETRFAAPGIAASARVIPGGSSTTRPVISARLGQVLGQVGGATHPRHRMYIGQRTCDHDFSRTPGGSKQPNGLIWGTTTEG
ncbi:hypothetical protein, partial [Frankia sp. Cr1]|uniref:hypothetical protein n=1 Tax=Frankia sp. Cr1 TaxID=3073931 RepID=UPI002AD41783